MANNYTDTTRNLMLAALPGTLYMSLHDIDPGQVGNNEVAGTVRQSVTLQAASNGVRPVSESFVDIEVNNGETVEFIGVFTALTGGNFIASIEVQPTTFTQDSVYRISDISFDLNLTCA